MEFEYVVSVGEGVDAAALGRDTGAAASQPMIGLRARRHQRGDNHPPAGSFVAVDDPRVEITHLTAENDGTIVVWLESHATEPVAARVSVAAIDVARAVGASFLGSAREALDVVDGAITIRVDPGAIRQLRVTTGR